MESVDAKTSPRLLPPISSNAADLPQAASVNTLPPLSVNLSATTSLPVRSGNTILEGNGVVGNPLPKPRASFWNTARTQVDENRKSREESRANLAEVMAAVQKRIADHSDVVSPGRAAANAVLAVKGDVAAAAAHAPNWNPQQLAVEARRRQELEEARYVSAFSPRRGTVVPMIQASEQPILPVVTPTAWGDEETVRSAEPVGDKAAQMKEQEQQADNAKTKNLGSSSPPGGGGPPPPSGGSQEEFLPEDDEAIKGYQWREQYVEVSCGCYPRDHCFRQTMVFVIEHVWFDRISMLMIILNCLTLGMYDAEDPDCDTKKCQVLAIFDLIFGWFFAFEMVMKMIAMGVWGKGSYLASGWNRLDFVIVVSTAPELVPGIDSGGLGLMRIARVLRPLRAINRLPSLRVLIKLIFETLPMLGNVVLLVAFIILVFSIMGVQLFMGVLGNRCIDPVTGQTYEDATPDAEDYICSVPENNGMATCGQLGVPNFTKCANTAATDNPNYNVISYDDLFHAFVVTFLVITCEGWTDIVYMVQDAYSFWVWVYFYALVVFGSLLAMNLFLVVVSSQFSVTKQREKAAMAKEMEALAQMPKRLTYFERFKAFLMEMLFGKKNKKKDLEDEEVFKEKKEKREALKKEEDAKIYAQELAEAEEERMKEMEELRRNELARQRELAMLSRIDAESEQEGTGGVVEQGSESETQSQLGRGSGSGSRVTPAITYPSSGMPTENNLTSSTPTRNAEAQMISEAPPPASGAAASTMTLGEQKIASSTEYNEEKVAYDEEGNRIVVRPRRMGVELIRWHIRQFVNSPPFNNFIMGCIVFNTIFMASEHYEQPDWLTDAQTYAEWTFNIVYIFEMALKLYGLGVEDYVTNPMNLFDGVLVINSIIEMAMGGAGGLAVLRTFRLMRIFKLFRFLPGLQNQVAILIASLGEVANFCVILLLFMFIYAVLGMYLFGAKFRFEDAEESSRCHFDNMYRAMVTVFQMLTIEDWPGVMYDGVRATTILSTLYFMSLIIVGNYFLCNLFIAILLDAFAERAKEKEREEMLAKQDQFDGTPEAIEKFRRFRENLTRDFRGQFFTHWAEQMYLGRKERLRREAERQRKALEELKAQGMDLSRPHSPPDSAQDMGNAAEADMAGSNEEGTDPQAEAEAEAEAEAAAEEAAATEEEAAAEEDDSDWSDTEDLDDPNVRWRDEDRALCMFPPNHPVREVAKWIVAHPNFDRFILFFILCNSLAMAFERPKMSEDEKDVLRIMGYIFNGTFLFEMIVKLIAWGLLYGKDRKTGTEAYLRDPWNCLDGFLVLVSVIDFILTQAGVAGGTLLRILKIMRLLRALRPLRVINKAPRLKRVVVCMIDSCASIGNTLIICGLVFLIFGILAVQLFGGKLYSCDPDSTTIVNTTDPALTKDDCEAGGGEWANATFNYDNLGEALLTLFYVVSFDGWVDLMYQGVDAKDVYHAPEEDYNEGACVFFIVFLIIGNFFVLNLFVGVIVDSFNNSAAGIMALDNTKDNEELEKERKAEELAKEKLAIETLFYLEYTEDGIHRNMYNLVTSNQFDIGISAVILANVICMAVEHHDQPQWLTTLLAVFNYIFTIVFLFEAVSKIIAFGFQRYLCSSVEIVASNWNRFDFFLVITSFVGIYFDNADGDVGVDPTMLRVLRVFRIARILRLLKGAKGLRSLLNTVAESLTQVASIGLLLVLAFFIYACAAVQVFGTMSCTDDNPCEGMSDHAHFENWPYAMLTLFRICTGDAGAAILQDCLRQSPACDDSGSCEENCCAQAPRPIVPIFFMSFTVLAQFIMLNVVVAVLMGQLEEENSGGNLGELFREDEVTSDGHNGGGGGGDTKEPQQSEDQGEEIAQDVAQDELSKPDVAHNNNDKAMQDHTSALPTMGESPKALPPIQGYTPPPLDPYRGALDAEKKQAVENQLAINEPDLVSPGVLVPGQALAASDGTLLDEQSSGFRPVQGKSPNRPDV